MYNVISIIERMVDMDKDIFDNQIFDTIDPPRKSTFKLAGSTLPNSQDIYFYSKWDELFERYQSARLFIRKCIEEAGNDWFNPVDDPTVQRGLELTFKAELYETALINYNILVDLSWTITYVSAEFTLYDFDNDGNITNSTEISGMIPIEEAYNLLRKTENKVKSPHAEGNPFQYLKVMAPEFSEAIDLIIDFWKDFSNSDIRQMYNYVKHKGKPRYTEIENLRGGKLFSIYVDNQEYPADVRDIQKIVSLEQEIKQLLDFDNEKLFPYIQTLLVSLKNAVNPSPYIIV